MGPGRDISSKAGLTSVREFLNLVAKCYLAKSIAGIFRLYLARFLVCEVARPRAVSGISTVMLQMEEASSPIITVALSVASCCIAIMSMFSASRATLPCLGKVLSAARLDQPIESIEYVVATWTNTSIMEEYTLLNIA